MSLEWSPLCISHSVTFLPPVYLILDSHSLVFVCVNADGEMITDSKHFVWIDFAQTG
jgi:hypothetical protein